MSKKDNVDCENEIISLSQEDIKKVKKKKRTRIIAIIVAAVIGLGIIGGAVAGFLTMDQEGSFFYKILKRGKITVPKNLRVEDFDQESDYLALIRWDEVVNATDYTLEVKYELYPEETETISVELNGRYVERKRGNLFYRVRANNLSGEGEFSQWEQFYIEPMQLELPEITMEQQGNNVVVTWTEVEYKYGYENEDVKYAGVYYEIIDGGYWYDEPEPEYWENNSYITASNEHIFPVVGRTDVFIIKVRPINYTVINTIPIQIIKGPEQLYDIYETPEVWAEAELALE